MPISSRLENIADWRALARIGLGQIDLYCRSFVRPPQRITLDIDDTDDPVHSQQELALFNAHYDCTRFPRPKGIPARLWPHRLDGLAQGIRRIHRDVEIVAETLARHIRQF